MLSAFTMQIPCETSELLLLLLLGGWLFYHPALPPSPLMRVKVSQYYVPTYPKNRLNLVKVKEPAGLISARVD